MIFHFQSSTLFTTLKYLFIEIKNDDETIARINLMSPSHIGTPARLAFRARRVSALRVAKVNIIMVTAGKYYGLARNASDREDVGYYYNGRKYFISTAMVFFFFFFSGRRKNLL